MTAKVFNSFVQHAHVWHNVTSQCGDKCTHVLPEHPDPRFVTRWNSSFHVPCSMQSSGTVDACTHQYTKQWFTFAWPLPSPSLHPVCLPHPEVQNSRVMQGASREILTLYSNLFSTLLPSLSTVQCHHRRQPTTAHLSDYSHVV